MQQQSCGGAQLFDIPAVDPDLGGGDMAEHEGNQRVRAVPGEAGDRAGGLPHGGVPRGADWGVLRRDLASVDLPLRHVPAHRSCLLFHHLRLRRD